MKVYYYLFYRFLRIWDKYGKDDSGFTAMLAFTLSIVVNIISISNLLSIFQGLKYDDTKQVAMIVIAGMFLVNYFVLNYNSKEKNIRELFKTESKLRAKIGDLITLIYILLTLSGVIVKVIMD